jgi:hypothetical protein
MTTPNPLQIAVLDRGFVYVGRCAVADGFLTITDARCIRRWGTTNGLGQLAASGPTAKTILDTAATIHAPLTAVVHLIDCAEGAWPRTPPAEAAA